MNINRVVLSGNLTRDPDMRTTGSGLAICKLRIACNTRRKDSSTGTWEDKANYFNVTVFGRQGENCGEYLSKGRGVMIDGRLEWSEYEVEGQKRQSVDIVAENVQFIGGRDDSNGGGRHREPESDIPADTSDFGSTPTAASLSDDDIPF